MSPAFDRAQLGVTGVGDLIEGASRTTIIAAEVSGFGGIEIGSAVDARSRDRASNPAGSRGIAQELCHAKAMERKRAVRSACR